VVSTTDIKLPEYRTQDLSTRVAVRSGQTVVMGGVLEREQTTFVESVPILGNIPIIGAAFRRRTEIDRPRYLLIFVTATLLSETGEFLVYDEPVTRPTAAPEPASGGPAPAMIPSPLPSPSPTPAP
jgi:type IV pilus assembly protein PilQ